MLLFADIQFGRQYYIFGNQTPRPWLTSLALLAETIYVELELKNPLKVPVQFTDVHVVCNLVPPGGAAQPAKNPLISSDGVVDSPTMNGNRKSDASTNNSVDDASKEPPLVTDNYEILL